MTALPTSPLLKGAEERGRIPEQREKTEGTGQEGRTGNSRGKNEENE